LGWLRKVSFAGSSKKGVEDRTAHAVWRKSAGCQPVATASDHAPGSTMTHPYTVVCHLGTP
jgi:hypothetical protein